MVNVSLSGLTDSFSSGISTLINVFENLIAPFVVLLLIFLFFYSQIWILRIYFRTVGWIANTAIPFLMDFHTVAHSYEKFREYTSTGLFNDRSRPDNERRA